MSGRIDVIVRSWLLRPFVQLFTDSFGDPKCLKELYIHQRGIVGNRLTTSQINLENVPMKILEDKREKNVRIVTGKFKSPYATVCPNHLIGPNEIVPFKAFLPSEQKGLCVLLPATGDQTILLREKQIARPLLQHGIATILPEIPFYGNRKPPTQTLSRLKNVSDLFVMGAAIIFEVNYLLQWAYKEGFWPLGISGTSLGGFMTSLAASNICHPVIALPSLSWTTAAPVYTRGEIATSIPYDRLQKQLEDRHYTDKLKEVPGTEWVDRARAMNDKNQLGLAKNLMWILMEDFTNLTNYPVPLEPALCHCIIGDQDRYIVRNDAPDFEKVWPGMSVEHLQGHGHVTAFMLARSLLNPRLVALFQKASSPDYYPKPSPISTPITHTPIKNIVIP
ncbi:hypothetical protein WR25_15284 [Diploscapter pachys]|uniref:AB hydrolase-1 domain-containing protein n=1 Tax=Diploscapter pachys TaxID=2018661 RepID=A0A2A2KFT6_9BILA|nr:hypothetical protein WR25_15284 [Diploscapter pachys]